MKTVLYLESVRKKKNVLCLLWMPMVIMLFIFFFCTVVDAVWPQFNTTYMKWPDMLRDFLSLRMWSGSLWMNIWQIFAMVYPFVIIYCLMKQLTQGLQEEKRLETIVYLSNAGVSRKMILLAKTLFWLGVAFVGCLSQFLCMILFLALGNAMQNLEMAAVYYGKLFGIIFLYLLAAAFLTVCKKEQTGCEDTILSMLFLPALFARVPVSLQFFAELLQVTGREGEIIEHISNLAEKSYMLELLSPITWCFTGMEVMPIGVLCMLCIGVVMGITALFTY